ncbi:LysR family transcriptional regulator [Undibacterium sp. MH2W]|uniref:LysR family transcriptional regulator n=1 Tax=Undibacterium sp. MH2W TaxID=3413044 RepID=UPI003BEF9ACC
MKKLDINDLYLIQAIDKAASLSGAASKLGISAAAVSRRVKKIEKLISARLIHRPGPYRLTFEGESFLRLANTVLDEHEKFMTDVARIKSGQEVLRLIGNSSIMISDIPQVIEMLCIKYPNIKVEIASGSQSEIIQKVLKGDMSAGLTPDNPKVLGIQYFKYRSDQLCVLARGSHPIANFESINFIDVLKYPLIGADDTKQIYSLIDTMAKRDELTPEYLITVSNFDLQANLVAQTDLGIAIMLESIARRFENQLSQAVKVIRLNDTWAERNLYVCVHDIAATSKITNDFIRLLRRRHKVIGQQ